jgi:hypothetical protein
MTNEKLLKNTNIHGLHTVMWAMDGFHYGSRDLWNKLTNLLETELKKKREPLDKDYLITFMQVLINRNIQN